MKLEVAESRVPDFQTFEESVGTLRGLANIQAIAHDSVKRQTDRWFEWMDGILDVHRSNFVFREATPAELAEHKIALGLAIEYCHRINTFIGDPGFNEPDLVSRLRVRIQQLQDAYDTFHDTALSDAQAEEILKQVFPE